MNTDAPEYTVTCFTLSCHWQADYATYQQAHDAGQQHQREHPAHITYALPSDLARKAA